MPSLRPRQSSWPARLGISSSRRPPACCRLLIQWFRRSPALESAGIDAASFVSALCIVEHNRLLSHPTTTLRFSADNGVGTTSDPFRLRWTVMATWWMWRWIRPHNSSTDNSAMNCPLTTKNKRCSYLIAYTNCTAALMHNSNRISDSGRWHNIVDTSKTKQQYADLWGGGFLDEKYNMHRYTQDDEY